jgi:hypothetical protein
MSSKGAAARLRIVEWINCHSLCPLRVLTNPERAGGVHPHSEFDFAPGFEVTVEEWTPEKQLILTRPLAPLSTSETLTFAQDISCPRKDLFHRVGHAASNGARNQYSGTPCTYGLRGGLVARYRPVALTRVLETRDTSVLPCPAGTPLALKNRSPMEAPD